MELFKRELQKVVLHRYFYFIIIGLFILNALLCFRTSKMEIVNANVNKGFYSNIKGKNYSNEEIKEILINKLAKMDIDATFTEYNVYRKALDQVEIIENYDDYLENIQLQGELLASTSAFGDKNDFTYRSILKMPSHYEDLQGTKLVLGNSQTVIFATERTFTDLFLILLVFFTWSVLLIEEKASGIQNFLKTTKNGRRRILYVKIAVSFTLCIMFAVLFYGSNHLISQTIYGYTDLFSPIQSLEGFSGSTLGVSIASYLIIYLITKILALFCISGIILLLSVLARNTIEVYGGIILIGGLSLLCFESIPENSTYAFIKYMNPVGLLDTNAFYKEYKDLNFFGVPVSIISSAVAVFLILILVTCIVAVFIFGRQRMIVYREGIGRELLHQILGRKVAFNKLIFSETKKSL